MTKRNPLKAISLFTGAGGLDFGLERAGFDTVVAIEMDSWCCKTLRHNRQWPVLEKKIEEVESELILETANLKKGEVALLAGGPPCQPFSKSSYWVTGDTKRLNDPRANTFTEYMRVLRDTLPEVFLIENVFGLAYEGKSEGLKFLEDTLRQINKEAKTNYSFNWQVINTADFGVPQIRERVFIVGNKQGLKFEFPRPRFLPQQKDTLALWSDDQIHRTAWDAIGDLADDNACDTSKIGGRWGQLLPTIPPGENYLWHTERGGGEPLFKWRSRYWSFLLKLHPDRPSWTIQANPGSAIGPFHWNNRRLTMREMARIQTFPDDVEILGGLSNTQRQLGNAVPSAIGELFGLEIKKQFFNCRVSSKDLSLIPPLRKKNFEISYVKKIPVEYKKQVAA